MLLNKIWNGRSLQFHVVLPVPGLEVHIFCKDWDVFFPKQEIVAILCGPSHNCFVKLNRLGYTPICKSPLFHLYFCSIYLYYCSIYRHIFRLTPCLKSTALYTAMHNYYILVWNLKKTFFSLSLFALMINMIMLFIYTV